jgi:hypothetical protein
MAAARAIAAQPPGGHADMLLTSASSARLAVNENEALREDVSFKGAFHYFRIFGRIAGDAVAAR